MYKSYYKDNVRVVFYRMHMCLPLFLEARIIAFAMLNANGISLHLALPISFLTTAPNENKFNWIKVTIGVALWGWTREEITEKF